MRNDYRFALRLFRMSSDKPIIPLSEIHPGHSCRVKSITSTQVQRILIELGIAHSTELSCLFEAPLRGPRAYQCGEIQFALRFADTALILVEPIA